MSEQNDDSQPDKAVTPSSSTSGEDNNLKRSQPNRDEKEGAHSLPALSPTNPSVNLDDFSGSTGETDEFFPPDPEKIKRAEHKTRIILADSLLSMVVLLSTIQTVLQSNAPRLEWLARTVLLVGLNRVANTSTTYKEDPGTTRLCSNPFSCMKDACPIAKDYVLGLKVFAPSFRCDGYFKHLSILYASALVVASFGFLFCLLQIYLAYFFHRHRHAKRRQIYLVQLADVCWVLISIANVLAVVLAAFGQLRDDLDWYLIFPGLALVVLSFGLEAFLCRLPVSHFRKSLRSSIPS